MTDHPNQATEECARCGDEFDFDSPHTELVRRDFVETPRAAVVQYLCTDCWQAYVEEFLGNEFDVAVS